MTIDERRCEAQTADPFEAILQECHGGSFVHECATTQQKRKHSQEFQRSNHSVASCPASALPARYFQSDRPAVVGTLKRITVAKHHLTKSSKLTHGHLHMKGVWGSVQKACEQMMVLMFVENLFPARRHWSIQNIRVKQQLANGSTVVRRGTQYALTTDKRSKLDICQFRTLTPL